MPAGTKTVNLILEIYPGIDDDVEELDRVTRQLLTEVLELEVESVQLEKTGGSLEGTKSWGQLKVGSMAVVVQPDKAPQLVEKLGNWSSRGENRFVKITAQFEGRSMDVEYSPATMTEAELKRRMNALLEALLPGAIANHGELR